VGTAGHIKDHKAGNSSVGIGALRAWWMFIVCKLRTRGFLFAISAAEDVVQKRLIAENIYETFQLTRRVVLG